MKRILRITGLTGRKTSADEITDITSEIAMLIRNPAKGVHTDAHVDVLRMVAKPEDYVMPFNRSDAEPSIYIDWEAGTIDAPQFALCHKVTFENIEVAQ